jgi:hypothetical protein
VDELAKTKLDRTHFSVAKLNDSDEKAYWLSKSPAERLEALELMRQMIYGYDPASKNSYSCFARRRLSICSSADTRSGITAFLGRPVISTWRNYRKRCCT